LLFRADLTNYSCLFAFIRGGLKQKKTKQVKKMSMMKRSGFFILLITVMVALGVSNPAQADKFLDTIDTFKKSEFVRPFLKSAYGYAVFPTVGKGGIGIGGAYGKGQVYRGGRVTGEAKP
jgi:hypothetical protein